MSVELHRNNIRPIGHRQAQDTVRLKEMFAVPQELDEIRNMLDNMRGDDEVKTLRLSDPSIKPLRQDVI